MKILFITNYFLPEIASASHLYFFLAKELIKRGHKVKVLTGIPRYNIVADLIFITYFYFSIFTISRFNSILSLAVIFIICTSNTDNELTYQESFDKIK